MPPGVFFVEKAHQIAPIVFGLEFEKIVMQLLVAAAGSFLIREGDHPFG